jgi:hypothetical protein
LGLLLLDNLQENLAGRALGIDLRNFHGPQILIESARFHQDRFFAR